MVSDDIDQVILHLEINPVIVPEVGRKINWTKEAADPFGVGRGDLTVGKLQIPS